MKKIIIVFVVTIFMYQYSEAVEPKSIFNHYCAPCHGETGRGDGRYYSSDLNPKPTDFTNIEYMKTRTDEQIKQCITDGSSAVGKSNLCPPWGKTISGEEINKLATYIRNFSSSQKIEKKNESPVSQQIKINVNKKSFLPILVIVVLTFIFLVVFFKKKLYKRDHL